MGKESALGQDPLRWMKITKENKKSLPSEDANAVGQNAEKAEQQTSIQATPKQIPLPRDNGETQLVSKATPPSSNRTDNPAAPKPRVVIGRLYEKPSPEKTKSVQRNEGEIQETGRSVEPSIPVSRTIQPINRLAPEINLAPAPASAAASQFSTYIIVGYTALLLILGYFVYSDLSKRTSRIEAKIMAIEKVLREKQ